MTFHFNPNHKYRISTREINLLAFPSKRNKTTFSEIENRISSKLKEILKPPTGIIDGDTLKNLFFPTDAIGDFDVFISHSHNDLADAQHLALFLQEQYKLNPFLDHFVWGSADKLLREIDDEYCLNPRGFYTYSKRNYTTSHVHSMLSMAISEMIAKCKIFIFIESNESLDYNALKNNGHKTLSPWLYQELQYVKMLSAAVNQPINEQRIYSSGGRISFIVRYNVDFEGFETLTTSRLMSHVPI